MNLRKDQLYDIDFLNPNRGGNWILTLVDVQFSWAYLGDASTEEHLGSPFLTFSNRFYPKELFESLHNF